MLDKVKISAGGHLRFKCPGCDEVHAIAVGPGAGPRWGYNGNPASPTFTPSVLARSGHFAGQSTTDCWCAYNRENPDDVSFECRLCHSFVADGKIQFLDDCSHTLRGQTVELPDWSE